MAPMPPDVNNSQSRLMNFSGKMSPLDNVESFESSYSEVEVSIESISDRAMTDDDESSGVDSDDVSDSSSESDGVSFAGGGYEELVETEDDLKGQNEHEHETTDDDDDDDDDDDNDNDEPDNAFIVEEYEEGGVEEYEEVTMSEFEQPEEDFFANVRQSQKHLQTSNRGLSMNPNLNNANSNTNSNSNANSDPSFPTSFPNSQSTPDFEDSPPPPPSDRRLRKSSSDTFDDGVRSSHRAKTSSSRVPPRRETTRDMSSNNNESEDMASSSRSNSKSNTHPNRPKASSPNRQKRTQQSGNSNGNGNSNSFQKPYQKQLSDRSSGHQRENHKSIKIPAVHTNKQDGDENYLRRNIEQEINRRSRSLSRHRSEDSSKMSGSRQRSNRHGRNRKARSQSSDRTISTSDHGGKSKASSQSHSQSRSERELDSSLQESTTSSASSRQQRSSSNPAGPRRLASIHSSTPSNQLTGTSTKSGGSKHSNFDGLKRVSWRSDPKSSFSDWTLHILYRDGNRKRRIDVYHLHRNVVGFGHRKSNFLLRDIMESEIQELLNNGTGNRSEAEVELQQLLDIGAPSKRKGKGSSQHKRGKSMFDSNNGSLKKGTIITRLKLPSESQARSVPMVLDFMYYTNETKQRMSADRSCNVFKVAEGLEVQALQKAIGEFYMKNLSLKNLGEFLTAATKVRADKLLTICKAKIGQMITVKPELSAMVPPKFMADILSISSKQLAAARAKEPMKYTNELIISQSRYWSKAACICASQNENTMTQKLFAKLTSEESLPYIDVSATPRLLSMESTFFGSDSNGGGRRNANQLTSLQRRCVESIGNDFDAFQKCFDTHQEIAESLKHLPSSILSEILMKLLTRP